MMTQHDFTPGDLVQLKSGGPKMTYAGDDTIGRAICVWFDGPKHERQCFNHATLEKAGK
jgi:uncharacterized protein YodC (DUF2158 family)